ncbi:hypothetical protein SLEP1_g23584 [Rubroshorea leprosula]|uniref:Uncharacterized protein n=1 Tax=Rubroshorea leprosula TaxID=152421 RepID=A0AAV5JPX9_9ROSI|nr:hypothetical protein SLEP1_g23584 [Rubroshorea leprosula]
MHFFPPAEPSFSNPLASAGLSPALIVAASSVQSANLLALSRFLPLLLDNSLQLFYAFCPTIP